MPRTFACLNRALVILLLLLCSGWVLAAACPHLTSERGPLYQHSAFAHGYIHGYEQGFHVGNQDLQLARNARDINRSDFYREAADEYHSGFGARDAFRAGYRDGLVIGYTDAMSGHSFRAIDEARIASARLDVAPDASAHHSSQTGKQFELGFMHGYRAGTLQGVGDGRNRATYRSAQAECSGAGEKVPLGEEYCGGYLRGFTFGYSDGYINHDHLVVAPEDTGHATVKAARK